MLAEKDIELRLALYHFHAWSWMLRATYSGNAVTAALDKTRELLRGKCCSRKSASVARGLQV